MAFLKEITMEVWKTKEKLWSWSLIRVKQESHEAEMEGRKEFYGALDDKQYSLSMKCNKNLWVQKETWSKQDEH